MHARLERLSIHRSSLSCAFVHQKGDYSANPALCHSQVCISKSAHINVVTHEEAVSCVCVSDLLLFIPTQRVLCRVTGLMAAKKNHDLWRTLFEPLVPYFTICVVYHVSVVASGRNQPSTPVRDRKSKFRL